MRAASPPGKRPSLYSPIGDQSAEPQVKVQRMSRVGRIWPIRQGSTVTFTSLRHHAQDRPVRFELQRDDVGHAESRRRNGPGECCITTTGVADTTTLEAQLHAIRATSRYGTGPQRSPVIRQIDQRSNRSNGQGRYGTGPQRSPVIRRIHRRSNRSSGQGRSGIPSATAAAHQKHQRRAR